MTMPVRDALLAAKLDGRARGVRVVDRARLRALLEAAPEARLVLVAAPAGFGKTTLLAAWVGAADVRSAWLALDPRDDDIVRFARYLAIAAGQLAGRTEGITERDPTQPFDPELALAGVLDPVAAALADGPAGGVVLVLDDYHVIDEPAIHRLVASLVERLPVGARLAIGTRADPPLGLARLRAQGALLELRAEDLRFTESEAGELLRAVAVELDPPAVAELVERTEGWAAVLRLAAISLLGRPDQAEQVRRFGASHRFVLDYVVEEVLGGLPFETQDFLLRTSVLDRLCGPLCDAVTGHANGQARLEELERANLLIIPLDEERRWYRYHALFAEVLRARLRILHRDDVSGLHARAATWLAAQGDDDEAIAHALRAGDLERTCAMIAEASLRWLNAGELRTVRRWLDALPADALRGHPQLSASYAWCLVLPGETDGVAERLADAERALAVDHDGDAITDAAVRTQLALIRSRLADLLGDAPTAIAQARLAGELVPAGLPPEADTTLRGDATVLLARGLAAAGDIDGAAEAYETSLPDLRAGGNLFAADRAIADLAAIAIARGDAPGAVRLCEAEIARASARPAATAGGAVWAALARARVELGQVELAQAAGARALELATRAGDAQVARSARSTLARAAEMQALDGVGVRPSPPAGPGSPVESLTAREIEVLRLVARGRSNSQIATELFVTVGTVKSHLHTISGKLAAANRVEAVVRGRELGLLD
jgi:LuxR family transcriptional regulator, maltose regulon positive regulatory protein